MSTTVDPARRPPAAQNRPSSRRGWWLMPEIVAFVLLAVLAVPSLGSSSGQTGLHGELAERASRLLEKATPAEHHDHGHEVVGEDKILCGIDVFGTEPSEAIAADDVSIVYGYYFCAIGRPGLPYLDSSRSDGPIVVRLKGGGLTVQTAGHGQGYQDRVRAMMPDEYENRCFNGLPDPTVADDVMARYKSEVQA